MWPESIRRDFEQHARNAALGFPVELACGTMEA
jgi:hypothetical protein